MSQTIFNLFEKVFNLMDALVYLMISFALVGFLWGIVKFLFANGNVSIRKEGKDYMIYGLITLFVMTSLWALVYLLKGFINSESGFGDIKYENNQVIDPGQVNPPLRSVDDLFDNNAPQRMI